MSLAFLFPGQGAQYAGMGKELNDNFPAAKKVFERAAERLGQEYVDVCFNGPEEKLRQTKFTQPALFIVSAAAFEVIKEAGWKPDAVAGHSLGEYSALYAAGAFDLDTGLALVKARGEFIQEASDKIPGTMAAILGLTNEQVAEICSNASAKGVCEAVNFNSPGQVVIAGAVEAVDEAVRLAQAAGSPKSVKLNVSGPFHSSLMRPAADRMADVLEKADIRSCPVQVFMNVDAIPTYGADEIRQKLVKQIDHPVQWETIMRNILTEVNPSLVVEVGAGRVLSGLLRRFDKARKSANIEDKKSADALLQSTISK